MRFQLQSRRAWHFSRQINGGGVDEPFSSQSSLVDELADGDLLAAWPTLTIQERRRLMHGLLEQVLVSRATKRGRKAEPIAERTQIALRGGAEL